MDKLTKTILTILTLFLWSTADAQDAFFTNFDYSNAQTNPTQAAISEDINLRVIHRSQWTTLYKPFTTSQFEGSFPLRKTLSGEKYGAIGISFVNDRLGEGGYLSTNQVAISFNYNFNINEGPSNLAFGLKAGYFNGASSIDAVTTGSQWNGASFDPQSSIGEDLTNPMIKGAEITPGLMWYQNDSIGDKKYYFGIAAYNILRPESGVVVQGFDLPSRYSVTGGGQLFTLDKLAVSPKFLFMLQGNQTQVVVGTDWMYHLQRTQSKKAGIGIGTYYRLGDAFIVSAKYLTNTIDIGVSYDMTTSNLTDGLNTNTGSLELFLNYKIASKKSPKPFLYTIEIYDSITKDRLSGNVQYRSVTSGTEGIIFNSAKSGTIDLNLKEEYSITVKKEGYNTQVFRLKNTKDYEHIDTVYLVQEHITFELNLQVFDKETNDTLNSEIYLIDSNSGEQKLVGSGSQMTASFEIGKSHKLLIKSEGYEDKEIAISHDKFGSLNQPVFLDKRFIGAYLKLKVIDEETRKELKSTVMVSDITAPSKPLNYLMVMNDYTPEDYPLAMSRSFEILVTKEGYFNNSIKLEINDANSIEKIIELSALGIGKSIVLDDLLFKTGKAELDKRSYRLLDQLVDFMNQNTTLIIEIGGHTDNVGSNSYNQKLSESRAKSAVEYIVQKGIDKPRLKAKGYGEVNPITDNSSEEGKTQNRRVEMKVIGK